MRKIWDIHGGVHPPENKHQSTAEPIGTISLSNEIILPLNQHIGAPSQPIVKLGDQVLKGQKIAEAQGKVSVPVHASTSGIVVAIEERTIPHASGMEAPCIVIQPDGQEKWIELHPTPEYTKLNHQELLEKIREAGIAGMGGAGFPSAVKLDPRADQKINTLILNGTECEPYITADDMLMRERAEDIVAGAELIALALGKPQEVLIGIEDNKPDAIAAMKKAVGDKDIEIIVFPTKYPSGGEKQLIQILTGKEVPSGKLPADIGIVVQNLGTAYAAYRAVRFGEPLISRITTIVGKSLKSEKNIEVCIGTPIEHILRELGWQPEKTRRLIIGGPMMGYAVDDTKTPVVKTTNCIIAPSLEEMPDQPDPQPCIRCGMCSEACPASLLPQQLFWFSQAEEFEKLEAHNLFDCIECGACSYVCPSNIPLVQYYRHSKSTIRQLDADKKKADRSRERFEFRKLRIAKAEEEKEAKRAARKKAAEEAKKRAAEESKKKQEEESLAQPENSQTQMASNEDSVKEKLERTIASAQNMLNTATEKLNEGKIQGDATRIEKLEARKKQAELKLIDATSKLKNHLNKNSEEQTIKEKIELSPLEKQKSNIETLSKRLEVAENKLKEAEKNQEPTLAALQNGVDKLKTRLLQAKEELIHIENESETLNQKSNETPNETESAAERAIEKAKLKAVEQANMSDDEKLQSQIESLKKRLKKAQERLSKAIEEDNENVGAFQNGVEKLQTKLSALQKEIE